MADYEESSRNSFNKRAATYDEDQTGTFTQRYKELLLAGIDNARAAGPGSAALDVACGTGTFLKMLGKCCPGIDGYGVDISENMLKVAQKKNPGFHFARGSASDLSAIADASMDLVTVSAAYHHFPDTDQFMCEAQRVLKPGGMILIAEPLVPSLMRPFINLYFKIFSKSGDRMMYTSRQIASTFARAGLLPQPPHIQEHIQICSAAKLK